MENLDAIENKNLELPLGSRQAFDEQEYRRQNLQVKEEMDEAKKQAEQRRDELMYRLFDVKVDYLLKSETWKKIEWYLQEFQNDSYFDNLSSQKYILNEIREAEDILKEPLIYQAAALLLANFEKGISPYRWLSGYENTGIWIKALLGKSHYNQFMVDKQKCIADIQSGSWVDRTELQDLLSICEMDYIVNNVSWTNWKQYFWFHNDLPWSILPNEFADRLAPLLKWWFNKSSAE